MAILISGALALPTTTFRELAVWQKGMDLADEVYSLSEKFPNHQQFGLTSQVQRAALSVPCNIAEGSGRLSPKEFMHFLAIARGSLRELETQLIFAVRRGYLTRTDAILAWDMIQEVGKMLNGLMASLKGKPKPK